MKRQRPIVVANNVTLWLDAGLTEDRYPVLIEEVAKEYSLRKFSSSCITEIKREDLNGFEGGLYKAKDHWIIIVNKQNIEQRIRFTLAHEFGHYLLHRDEVTQFECSLDYLASSIDNKQREKEADEFAANILMPLHDFRKQVNGNEFSFELIEHCMNRYETSLTATILQWITFTHKRAVIVESRDGFMLWSRSSKKAYESGVYFKTECSPPLEMPLQPHVTCYREFRDCPVGVWGDNEESKALTIQDKKFDRVITLILLSDSKTNATVLDSTDDEDISSIWEPPTF